MKECYDFLTILPLAWGLGKHSGTKVVKRLDRRSYVGEA